MEQFEVEEARDGREAVEKFLHSPKGYYQIILMDIQMPMMNGYEATKAIRKLDREDAHLSKPLDMEKVAEACITAMVRATRFIKGSF